MPHDHIPRTHVAWNQNTFDDPALTPESRVGRQLTECSAMWRQRTGLRDVICMQGPNTAGSATEGHDGLAKVALGARHDSTEPPAPATQPRLPGSVTQVNGYGSNHA